MKICSVCIKVLHIANIYLADWVRSYSKITDDYRSSTPFINSFNNLCDKKPEAQLQRPSFMSFNISNCFPIEPFWIEKGSNNLLYWQKIPYLKTILDIFYCAGVPVCYCVHMYLHILLCVCPHGRLMLVSIRSRTFYLAALFIKHTTAAVCVCVCVCVHVCVCALLGRSSSLVLWK